jgi:hypothetical protein
MILSPKAGIYDLNTVKYFSENQTFGKYCYFSILNPRYVTDDNKNYIYNCSKEIAKFIGLNIEATSDENSFGSFQITDQNIFVSYDAALVEEFIDDVSIVQIIPTEYGDILTLKISRDRLREIWEKHNKKNLPEFDLKIEQKITGGFPSWFLDPPEIDGFIVGTGSFNSGNDIFTDFKNSDYYATADIIKTLKVHVKSELNDYIDSGYEVASFFNEQTSKASLGGIIIIKRYFDKKTNTAYSLGILKK